MLITKLKVRPLPILWLPSTVYSCVNISLYTWLGLRPGPQSSAAALYR